jgi:Flp pilus assembly pilin Flp
MALRGARDDHTSMPHFLNRIRRSDGQTMTEYAVVLAVITPAIILAFGALSGAAAGAFQSIIGSL